VRRPVRELTVAMEHTGVWPAGAGEGGRQASVWRQDWRRGQSPACGDGHRGGEKRRGRWGDHLHMGPSTIAVNAIDTLLNGWSIDIVYS
jgi:hypothetical protein